MQYIGIKDTSKPPKEIYEKDILQNDTRILFIESIEDLYGSNTLSRKLTDYNDYKIIGNKFENPKLWNKAVKEQYD
jgi:hypothetical protein